MLYTHIKTAWRNIKNARMQSAILIGGLAMGMAATILLLQYVSYELSFDDFHHNKSDIYRVVNERFQDGKSVQKGTITYPTIGPAMIAEYPEIINATRIGYSSDMMVIVEERVESVEPALWADEKFFDIFDFELLADDGQKLLDQPNEVVLTQGFADRFFAGLDGNYENLIGTEISIDRYGDPFKVVGICQALPPNSSLQFEILTSYASCIKYWGDGADNSWQWSDFYHYLLVQPDTDITALENKFVDFSERHFRGAEVSGSDEVFTLQALADAHLYSSDLEYEINHTTQGRAVWSLLIIAFFILTIAWINYTNLSSVKAIERAKEVGVRKVVGATRRQLIWQFLLEALLTNLLSILIAFALVQLLTPWFAQTFNLPSSSLSFFEGGNLNGYLITILAGLIVTGVVVSGIYPAFLLSGTQVSNVLKGSLGKTLGGAYVRKGLVVFQFTMSIALIIATVLVSMQIKYMSQQDLGIDIDQIMIVNSPELSDWDSTFINRMEAFKGELTKFPGIVSAATSNRAPGDMMGRGFQIRKTGSNSMQTYSSNFLYVDHDYAETYELDVLEGRFFRKEDHHNNFDNIDKLVISESAVKMFNYESSLSAIGQKLIFIDRDWEIVGVVPDFHQRSLQHAIEPIIFVPNYGTSNLLSIKVFTSEVDKTISLVQNLYHDFFPGNTFRFEFLDAHFNQLYQAEERFSKILLFFTILTILIACLGLFGLASYTTYLRTKEIGIRKVLGASTLGIISLVSTDFLKLIALAALVAMPLAYILMREWLKDFAYATTIPWWVFLASGVIAILIAMLTIGYQSIKVASINPAKSIRQD